MAMSVGHTQMRNWGAKPLSEISDLSGTPDTVHVSATHAAFTMSGGLEGDAARWIPGQEDDR